MGNQKAPRFPPRWHGICLVTSTPAIGPERPTQTETLTALMVGLTGKIIMNTRGSRSLYRYWHTIKDGDKLPGRHDVEPRGLKEVLPWIFILDRIDWEVASFRIAGTGICEHYGRELRGSNFLSFWLGDCRRTTRSLIENVVKMPTPAFMDFEAQAINGRHMYGEILLLPLAPHAGGFAQVLGGWFPTVTHDPLLEKPLVRHHVRQIKVLDDEDAKLRPADVTQFDRPERDPAPLRLVVSNSDSA